MTKKKSDLTPEEKALFRNSVKGTTRIKSIPISLEKNTKFHPKRPLAPAIRKTPSFEGSYEIYLQNLAPDDWLTPEDTINFARVGVQNKTLMKLKKGHLPIEAKLDLHQLTTDEAIEASTGFINMARANHLRTVLIVHGKGQFSQHKGPILKNLIVRWLREQETVLAVSSCQPKDGGSGALYVLLKKQD